MQDKIWTPLMAAAREGHLHILKWLTENMAYSEKEEEKIDALNSDHVTALFLAVHYQRVPVIENWSKRAQTLTFSCSLKQ